MSNLTARAQETYAGIRIVKAFAQHTFLEKLFRKESNAYKNSALQLSMIESIYFPSMNLFIGLSMLFSVLVGGYLAIQGKTSAGHIAEFIMYINLLMFPISSIGWVASIIQRAAASQKRINDFLQTKSTINDSPLAKEQLLNGDISFDKVNFTYPHTGIQALHNFSLHIPAKSSIAILGKTGAGKSTLINVLMRYLFCIALHSFNAVLCAVYCRDERFLRISCLSCACETGCLIYYGDGCVCHLWSHLHLV